jgi:glycosyltransferase involved in cell wall biosynthesis
MDNIQLKILYINLGGTAFYAYDKPAGRILGWAKTNNNVFILAPQLDFKTIKKEILDKEKLKIKAIFFPFTKKETNSIFGIIIAYFIRVLISPLILFKNLPVFDFSFSNSCFFVDIIPALWLKIFGRCRYWILMMDSVVPSPKERNGNFMVNFLTYLESIIVGKIANIFADIIFTVNPELKKEMVKRGIKKEKIIISQNGLFMEKINYVKEIKNKKYDAVYMGRISVNKGILDLIKIWGGIVKKMPKAKLAIMGMGLDNVVEKFKSNIKENGLEKNIDYLGFVPRPKKYEFLKNSKVFLYLPKINSDESWGISLMEALACGLPAISYNLPIYENIYKTKSLIRVKLNDIDSVTEKLFYLLKNKKIWASLSRESINFAKNFDWFKIANKDLKLIRNFLNI